MLSELNIPPISPSILRRHKKQLTIKENGSHLSEEPVKIAVSTDGAWPKRGNGHNYDSRSGTL